MTERTITVDGTTWTVSMAGRSTGYGRDELPLLFERDTTEGTRERRIARFSPRGGRSRSLALRELTDAELAGFLRHSQPSWTSPELGYVRA